MAARATPRWDRVLLKLSGEAFAGSQGFGIDPATVLRMAEEIRDVHSLGVQVAVVVGGGNVIRGDLASQAGIERATADHMGMLATVINALALQDALEKLRLETRMQTGITMTAVAEPFIRRRAIRHLEKGRVVVFGAGTGIPYFTTDTAAALRAVEIRAQAILKATNVDGVYDRDPRHHEDARRFTALTHEEALRLRLQVMDLTAFTLSMENGIPIVVFDLGRPGNVRRVLVGDAVGTVVGAIASQVA
ncbi:MAG: UMP kinase [Armatimonadetes bacterium]|nr:UMP kinase [Armatimonadota bacterium]